LGRCGGLYGSRPGKELGASLAKNHSSERFVKNLFRYLVTATLLLSLAACNSSTPAPKPTPQTASTRPPANPLRNAYFGDLHLHTGLSFDAYILRTNTRPNDSYAYAKGQPVNYLGRMEQRKVPLDFLAVTDHAEYLGALPMTADPNSPFSKTEWAEVNSSDPKKSNQTYAKLVGAFMATGKPIAEMNDPSYIKSAWQQIIDAADKNYEPGKFTTFVGFEWTSAPIAEHKYPQNLHRCIIFRGDKVPEVPYSAFDSFDPEQLWSYLENARKTGDDVIAVPHNGNASNGLMFDTKTLTGKPLTRDYAERRMANEPLTEIAQVKGQSETHPLLSPNDEFARYELWETLVGSSAPAHFKTGSYVRQAYGVGQELQEKIGANPFKYGLEGGTDFHSGISSTEEDNYPGSHGNQDSDPKTVLSTAVKQGFSGEPPINFAAQGLTGAWAEENTRESIFSAFKRKETFGTSGNRIQVRMFGGWNYPADLAKQPDWVKAAYSGGVPMGSDLPAATNNPKGPAFAVWSLKDPRTGNLDRIQIIKVSTKNGKSHEKIFDVAWSGDRKPDPKNGKVPPVGNTVDLKTATYTNTIGATELAGVWQDPEFDPQAYATYYARVLEIPTPRWSTIWAVKNNLPLNDKMGNTIQERAWTSPIWYSPTPK
jgi:hypothetical protein